jgi:hypothetical protein
MKKCKDFVFAFNYKLYTLKFYLYTGEFREIKIKGLQKALGYVIMGYKSFLEHREGVFLCQL